MATHDCRSESKVFCCNLQYEITALNYFFHEFLPKIYIIQLGCRFCRKPLCLVSCHSGENSGLQETDSNTTHSWWSCWNRLQNRILPNPDDQMLNNTILKRKPTHNVIRFTLDIKENCVGLSVVNRGPRSIVRLISTAGFRSSTEERILHNKP